MLSLFQAYFQWSLFLFLLISFIRGFAQMALCSLRCADVPLTNCWLTRWLALATGTHFSIARSVNCHICPPCLVLKAFDGFGRYTCWVHWHIVLDGGPWLPWEGDIGGWTPSQNLHLPTSDSPGGSTDQRFCILPNYSSLSFLLSFSFALFGSQNPNWLWYIDIM